MIDLQNIKKIDSKIGFPITIFYRLLDQFLLRTKFIFSAFKLKKIKTSNSYSDEIITNGFVVIRGLLDKGLLKSIRRDIDKSIDSNYNLNQIVDDSLRSEMSSIRYLSSQDISRGQEFLSKKTKYISIREPFIGMPQISNIAFDSNIVKVVNSAIGYPSSITGVNLRKSYFNNIPAQDTQCYHVDKNSINFLKVLIYLNDVDEKSGPFVYVARSHKKKPPGWLKNHRYSDEEIANFYGEDNLIKLTGSIGDVIIANTTGVHKGLKPTGNNRYLLTLNYAIHSEFSTSSKQFEIKQDTFTNSKENMFLARFLKMS